MSTGRAAGSPTEGVRHRWTVGSDAAGRLDSYVAAHLGLSRSRVAALIAEGRVLVDGGAAKKSEAVVAGRTVEVSVTPPAPSRAEPEDIPLDIAFEDRDLVVVNKPPGLVVHPALGNPRGTLVNALLHHVGDLSGIGGTLRPGIVHRLDRGTSGLMVVAKNDHAHAELARQFQERAVEKEYVALVWGVVLRGRRIDLPIGRDPVERKKISARSRRAREAVTRVTQAELLDGVSLVHVVIATGRTHQIRVHLAAIGHPVVGDGLYGGTRRHPPPHLRGVQRLERPFLHACRLAFAHPRDGRPVTFACELPADLAAVLETVRAATAARDGAS